MLVNIIDVSNQQLSDRMQSVIKMTSAFLQIPSPLVAQLSIFMEPQIKGVVPLPD